MAFTIQDKIPESIMKAAERVAEGLNQIAVTHDDMLVIARAIMAEREACLNIALDKMTYCADQYAEYKRDADFRGMSVSNWIVCSIRNR